MRGNVRFVFLVKILWLVRKYPSAYRVVGHKEPLLAGLQISNVSPIRRPKLNQDSVVD